MKSFRSIVLEEDGAAAAAGIPDVGVTTEPEVKTSAENPGATNDTGLEDNTALNSVAGDGSAPLSVDLNEEGVDAAADQVAADIVDGKDDEEVPEQGEQSVDAGADGEDVAPEDAPVASVAADDEPVASVDAPHEHEEPDGDEGPNPTMPSDNDGDEEAAPADEENPDMVETAAVQSEESLAIVQCSIIALGSAMKINEAAATEAFLSAGSVTDKQVVVEGFKDKVKTAWKRFTDLIKRIKAAIIAFTDKITLYVKRLFANVYAKMAKTLLGKKTQENWSTYGNKLSIKVCPSFAKAGLKGIASGDMFSKITTLTTGKIATIQNSQDDKKLGQDYGVIQDASKKLHEAIEEDKKGKKINANINALFGSYAATNAFISGSAKEFVKKAVSDKEAVVKACDKAIKEIESGAEGSGADHNPQYKVKLLNMASVLITTKNRANAQIIIKALRYAVSAMRVARMAKPVKNSYIDDDLLAFFNA